MNNNDLHDERISRLYKMGENIEPPAQLDATIKQAAQEAIAKKKRAYTWPSLATAAVLVLSITLILKTLEQKPLEEQIMQPIPEAASSVQPEVILQEDSSKAQEPLELFMDMDARDKEAQPLERKAIPERPKAKLRKAAPAPQPRKNKTEKAAPSHPSPAPVGTLGTTTDDEMAAPEADAETTGSAFTRRLHCGDIKLPETDSVVEWSKLYRQALEQGQSETADCIQQTFYTKFGRTIPKQQ